MILCDIGEKKCVISGCPEEIACDFEAIVRCVHHALEIAYGKIAGDLSCTDDTISGFVRMTMTDVLMKALYGGEDDKIKEYIIRDISNMERMMKENNNNAGDNYKS